MNFTFYPHTRTKDPHTGIDLVDPSQSKDYVMLSNSGETVYVQEGQTYFGDLDTPCPVEDLPSWFWSSYRNLVPASRKACGLQLPEDEIKSVDQLPAEFLATLGSLPTHLRQQLMLGAQVPQAVPSKPKVETSDDQGEEYPPEPEKPPKPPWTCPECQEEMPTKVKGVHMARHSKERTARERDQARTARMQEVSD